MSTNEKQTTPPDDLTLLGAGQTDYPTDPAEAVLETFANSHPGRDYGITFDCPEFTSICPITGQPDFGHITIRYIADQRCIESKALKLYLYAYRNQGAFHEAVVNRILDDIVAACAPRQATVTGVFRPRGGIAITVEASA